MLTGPNGASLAVLADLFGGITLVNMPGRLSIFKDSKP